MLGIIGAMDVEVNNILSVMEDVEEIAIGGITFFKGYIDSKEVVLSKSNVGKANGAITATLLINEFQVTEIINTGIAGGVSPLKTKDIVLADRIYHNDVDATIFGYPYGQVPGMPLYYEADVELITRVKQALRKLNLNYKNATIFSGDKFTTEASVLDKFDYHSLAVFEMEGSGIAQACVIFGVPFVSIRYISDIIGCDSQIKDYHEFETEMANNSSNICLMIIKNME